MATSNTPWMGVVTLATANTVYQLSALLQALSAARKPSQGSVSGLIKAASIQLQGDPSGGATKYYIGNSDMSSTDFGALIFASQVFQPPSLESNLYVLNNIYLMADADNSKVYVLFVTR